MRNAQPGILAPVPHLARYLFFNLETGAQPSHALLALQKMINSTDTVVGFGQSLLLACGAHIENMKVFSAHSTSGIEIPSTPAALWCWLRGDDRGELLHRSRVIQDTVSSAFILQDVIDAFQYGPSLDLTGYEDGTENPKDEEAEEAAIVHNQGEGLDGSSFVAVQQWLHDLDKFETLSAQDQDNTIGRRKSDNEELDDAPDSAHVKRTAQESFTPEAFILRRSMPWANDINAGLVFVAFGKTFDAFETLLQHMLGKDDGVTDALFNFTQPLSGSYFWCPPIKDDKLDLRALGL